MVESLPEENIEPLPALLAGQGLQCRIGKRSGTNETILLLDPNGELLRSGGVGNPAVLAPIAAGGVWDFNDAW